MNGSMHETHIDRWIRERGLEAQRDKRRRRLWPIVGPIVAVLCLTTAAAVKRPSRRQPPDRLKPEFRQTQPTGAGQLDPLVRTALLTHIGPRVGVADLNRSMRERENTNARGEKPRALENST
jgi:hypothetical protein